MKSTWSSSLIPASFYRRSAAGFLAKGIAPLLFFATLSLNATAAGGLDPTFGSGGKVSLRVSGGPNDGVSSNDHANSVAVDSSGRIVLMGFAGRVAAARFAENGSLDTSFGDQGTFELAREPDIGTYATAGVIDSSGRIVMAGRRDYSWPQLYDVYLVRLTANGSLDTSFGTGGKVSTNFGAGWTSAEDVVLDTSGRILVAGELGGDFLLARYSASGTLDASFGSGGLASADFSGAPDGAYSLLIDSNGRILVAGASQGRFALARFTSSGALDTTFGSGGKVATTLPGAIGGSARDIAIDAQGRIVVSGYRTVGEDEDHFALARYTAAGVLDTSFGGGVISSNLGGSNSHGNAVMLDSDGNVIVAGGIMDGIDGSAAGDFVVLRYTSSGVPDSGFGTGGRELIDFHGFRDSCHTAMLDAEGRLLLAGSANISGSLLSSRFAVARYRFIVDETPPVIAPTASNLSLVDGAAGNQTAVNNWLANHGGANATDNEGAVTWTDNYSVLPPPGGSVTVTFTARDPSGNQATTSAQIIMRDETPPVFSSLPSNLTIVDGALGNPAAINNWLQNHGGATAADNSGSVTWSHNYTSQPIAGTSATITFTANDAAGNSSIRTAQLIVLDQTPPSITSPAIGLTVACDAPDKMDVINAWLTANGTATATDNSGSVAWSHNFTTLPAACGTRNITFTAEDASGNESTTTAVLTQVDNTAPVFSTSAADLVVESNGSGNATQRSNWLISRGGAVAADSCGSATISHNFTALANNLPQTVPVTFTAADSCGNTSTSTANFIIQDTTPPQLTTPARDFYGSQATAAANIATFLSTRGGAHAVDIAGPVTWTHNFNGTPPPVGGYTTVTFTATDTVGLSVSTTCRLFLFPSGTVWIGPASGFWSTGTNWFSSGTSTDYYVDLFSFQNTHTTLNGNYTLQNLHVGAGDRVDMAGSITLNGTINNAGIIRSRREDDTQGFSNYLVVNGQARLEGPGRFILGGAAKNQIVPGTVAPYELTVSAAHEITTSSDTYGGYQGTSIHTRLVNQGTLTADGGVLNLYSLPKVNQGTFRAINGGQLELQANVDNTGGTVLAGANSTIYHNAALTGGTVTGPGRLLINSNGNFIGPMLLESSLTTALDGGNTGMAGTITNNGLLTIGSATSTNSAYLYLNGPVTLNGSGKLLFQNLGRRQILAATNIVTDVLTIGSQQEIITDARTDSNYQSSSIHARIINEGTVTANRGQLSLYDQPKINHNLLRAINGGFLNMQANVDNTGATVLAGAGSTVNLNAALTGGTVTGPGRLLINSNGHFIGPMLLDSGLTTNLDGGNTGMAGTITNNGLLTIGSATSTNSAYLYLNGPVTLNGSGKLRFQNLGRRQILAATNAATDILTIGTQQEITTDARTDYNYQSSAIHAGVVDHGIISADAGKLNLYNQPKINHGTMRAINGGALVIQAHTDNTSGTLFVDPASLIYPNANITGGTITGGGTLLVNAGVNFIGPILLDNGLTTAFDAGNSGLAGTITQNGLMTLGHASDGNTSNLYINGPVSLEGTGKLVFQGGGRRQILRGSASTGDVGLTIGPGIELTTDANTGLNYQATSIHAPVVNNGTITANGGGLVLYAESKTNNGTIRAINGGRLLFQSVTITNYNATTDTLSGGRWEVESNGLVTWIDWGNSPVLNLAAGTTFRLSGANASFAPLASLRNIQGTLSLENGKTLATSGNMVIPGRLQFGLPAAQDTTRLAITGNVDFTGATVDVASLGMTTGSYILATWTGSVTGAPVLGIRPPGMTQSLVVDAAAKQLRLEVFVFPPVEVTTLSVVPGTGDQAGQNIVTIAGTGHPHASYLLEATSDLKLWTPVSSVAASPTGAISWQFMEPATLRRRFYRFLPQ